MTGNRQTTEASAGERGDGVRKSAGADVEEPAAPRRPAGRRSDGRKSRRPPEFVVDPDLCKSCGICTKLCPHGVLSTDAEGLPVATDPEACTRCLFCEQHCPDFALQLVDTPTSEADPGETSPADPPAAGAPAGAAVEDDEGDD
jgi:2-oxoglutarate ferredoxin oxidoreductase subunit delta